MNLEKLRQFHSASPFYPFTVHLADGRNVLVPHPEFLMISPEGDECAIYERDGRVRHVDLALITELERNAPRNGARSTQGKRKRR